MMQTIDSSPWLAWRFAMVCVCAALVGCRASQPVNSAAPPAGIKATKEDTAMRPDRLLANCVSFESAGNYVVNGTGVSFYVGRDGSGDSIRKVQDLMATCDFTLIDKHPHTSEVPSNAGALWMKITRAGGAPVSLRIYNGTSYIASDGLTDWQWRGGAPQMYFSIVNAFAPDQNERHEEPAQANEFGERTSQTSTTNADPIPEAAIKDEPAKKPERTPVGTQEFRRALRR